MSIARKITVTTFAIASLGFFAKADAVPYVGIFPEWTLGEKLADRMAPFPPLPANLKEGNTFDSQNVVKVLQNHENFWYRIPKWFAGEFAYGEMTCDYKKDLLTNKITHPEDVTPALKSGRHRGMLTDKKGNIWQLSKGGEIKNPNASDTGTAEGHHRIDNAIVGMINSPTEYVEVSESVNFVVDKTSKITHVTRSKRWRDFFLQSDGSISINVQEMEFDVDGRPTFLAKAGGTMHKVHNFEPLTAANEQTKGEYEESAAQLRSFMKSKNLTADAP